MIVLNNIRCNIFAFEKSTLHNIIEVLISIYFSPANNKEHHSSKNEYRNFLLNINIILNYQSKILTLANNNNDILIQLSDIVHLRLKKSSLKLSVPYSHFSPLKHPANQVL